jgi:hypothetical protein
MKPLPQVVSYEDWMKQTSKILLKRSPELKAVDAGLQKYQRSPSYPALLGLTQAFDAWKLAHGKGSEWRDSARNTNQFATLLDNQLTGVGDTDVALGAQAFMEPALINTRLGVLYLYSNLECNDMFKVILEGAIDFTTASLEFADVDGKIGSGLEGAQGTAGSAARFVEEKVREKIRKQEGRTTPVTSNQLLETTLPPPPGKLRAIWDKIREKLYELAQKLMAMAREQWEKAREKWRWAKADPGGTALAIAPTALRKLCDFLATHVLASAAPFIGAGLDIAKGILNTIDASLTKYREWAASKEVELVIGHPATIAEAIRRAMWLNVGKGLYESLKGGLDLGLQFASQGASSIVSLVMAAVEALAKTIWKLVEVVKMRSIFAQGRELWESRMRPDSLHLRPIEFNAWFKGHALMLPALPVLVLNTGICGDKMHFMKMFKDDSTVITQASFDAGCRYVDSLKSWGSDYLKDSGFGFTSKDPVVKGLIGMARKHEDESSPVEGVWKATLGFVNA